MPTTASGGEHGFTLVEMLASMTAGLVLVLATFTFLDVSARQSASAIDRVEATQHGRIAMERLVQELHSSCVWASVTPVLGGSDGSNIWFISAFSSTSVPTPVLHKVWLAPGGVLKDAVYPLLVSSTPPAGWTLSAFSSTPTSTKTLATNVSYMAGTGSIFQYYQYVSGQIAGDAAHQLTSPLSASTAPNASEVAIGFAAGPSDTSSQANRTINLADTVVFTPPPDPTFQCQ